jgi:hypothetical protein
MYHCNVLMVYSGRLFPIGVLAAGLIGSSTGDHVILQNTSGNENGLLVWGAWGSTHLKQVDHTPNTDIHSFGNTKRNPSGANEVVAFTIGRPPATQSDVDWKDGATSVTLSYPDVYHLNLKIWVLCPDAICSNTLPEAKKTDLDAFLIWSNTRLEQERTGLALQKVGPDLISDQTANEAKRTRFSNFVTPDAGVTSNDCDSLGMLTDQMIESNAFNIYMVGTVDGEPGKGHVCVTADLRNPSNIAIVGASALWGTMLHEIGHDLSLSHIDGISGFGQSNLMYSVSSTRQYLSEGQVFRIHFSCLSALNRGIFAGLPPRPTLRDCDASDPTDCLSRNPAAVCPREGTWLFPDQ